MASNNIWQELRKKGPIMVLAPMADVTDAAFRQIIRKYSGNDYLAYTEFVSADGLCNEIGRKKLMRELYFTPADQPIIAQLFSSRPEKMEQAAKLCAELGFAGVDINMGCPDQTIEKQGCGSAMIKNPKLAQEITAAAKQGVSLAKDFSGPRISSEYLGQTMKNPLPTSPIPVSVKTRVGYNKVELETWAPMLLEAKPDAIIFHLRTRKEMSKVPANWDLITIPRDMAKGSETLILGNGDVKDLADAHAKAEKYQIDGVMIGRAIFGNPWLFADKQPGKDFSWSGPAQTGRSEDLRNHLRVAIEHTKLFEELFGQTETNQKLFGGHTKSFAIMKKHFKAYINGFDGANELRLQLMEATSAGEVENLINQFLQK